MEDWKKLIYHSFGSIDKRFARHPTDRENARKMILAAYQGNVSGKIVEQELKIFMREEKCSDKHIEEEIEWFHHGWAWLT